MILTILQTSAVPLSLISLLFSCMGPFISKAHTMPLISLITFSLSISNFLTWRTQEAHIIRECSLLVYTVILITFWLSTLFFVFIISLCYWALSLHFTITNLESHSCITVMDGQFNVSLCFSFPHASLSNQFICHFITQSRSILRSFCSSSQLVIYCLCLLQENPSRMIWSITSSVSSNNKKEVNTKDFLGSFWLLVFTSATIELIMQVLFSLFNFNVKKGTKINTWNPKD